MNGLTVFLLFIVGAVVSCFILYMVVKAAVRDGIIESRQHSNSYSEPDDTVAKITCPECGNSHEMDYPKCPHCGHVNFE